MTGHIERRGKRSWRVKFDAGTDPATGKRVTRRVTVKGTKKDADRKRTELLAARDTGSLVAPNKVTVGEYLAGWLAGWCRLNLSPTTRERYALFVKNQITPRIGTVRLQNLQANHLNRLYADLRESGSMYGGGLSASS